MPTLTITGTRCPHNAERDACPWCEVETRATGQRVTRSARRLSQSLRRAIRDAERERDELRGYALLAGTVSAHGATSPVLRAVTDAAESVGRDYFADLVPDTLRRFAGYVGRADGARVARVLTSDRYAYRLARRIAESIARDAGTGRGSMSTFTVDTSDAERELVAIYRRAIRATGAAFTVADGNGRRRVMTDAERELVLDLMSPERVARAPMYAQWLGGLGESLPDVRDGHGTGHVAPYVPERDAAPLRRGNVWQRLRAVGADADTVRALRTVWDIVNAPDDNGRYRATAPWQTVRDVCNIGVTSGTVQRRARRYAAAMRERERWELRERFAVDTAGTVSRVDGAPFTVPDAERPTPSARLVPVRTGNYIGRGTDTGAPVIAPTAPYRWQTVGDHMRDADTGETLCARGGRCADGCDALQLLPDGARDTGAHLERPLFTGDGCGHVDGCPIDCGRRVARARRVARWDTVPANADADTVRALVARNAAERAQTGT